MLGIAVRRAGVTVDGITPSKQRESISSAIMTARRRAAGRLAAAPRAGPGRLHEHVAHLHAQRDAGHQASRLHRDRGTPTMLISCSIASR